MFFCYVTKGLGRVALVAPLLLGLSACSSSSPSAASGGSTASGETYQLVSAADVARGLSEVDQLQEATLALYTTSPPSAKANITKIYDKWYEVEGSIRKNDKAMYLDLEDGLSAFKGGIQGDDSDKAIKGKLAFTTAKLAYLNKFPGGTP
jgi:hypothetical protein